MARDAAGQQLKYRAIAPSWNTLRSIMTEMLWNKNEQTNKHS